MMREIPTPDRPLLLSIEQAAALLGVSESGLYKLIADGQFPVPDALCRVGNRHKIKRLALEAWAAGEVA